MEMRLRKRRSWLMTKAGPKSVEAALQVFDGDNVEMVGWFVQQQHIRIGGEARAAWARRIHPDMLGFAIWVEAEGAEFCFGGVRMFTAPRAN